MNFIDIHNHFTWDIDDGMESKEQAILALEGAKKDGVRAIEVSTPHFIPGKQDRKRCRSNEQQNGRVKLTLVDYGIEGSILEVKYS